MFRMRQQLCEYNRLDGAESTGRHQPRFFIGVTGVALNYSFVILIMVCLFVGRVVVRLSRRCAGFHAPAGSFHDRRDGRGGGQVGAGMALIACQVLITSVVQGQSARRCSQRLRCPRVSRAGSCHSR